MTEDLLKQMIAIVDKVVKSCKSDFYTYDLHSLSDIETPKFIWSVRESGTRLLKIEPEKLLKTLRTNELCRFSFMHNPTQDIESFLYFPGVKTFHYDGTELKELKNPEQDTHNLCDKMYKEAEATIQREFGTTEGSCWHSKIPIRFSSERIARRVWDELHMPEGGQLLAILKRFHQYVRLAVDEKIVICPDYDKHSFSFYRERNGECVFNGGILFYSNGWHMHT